ncbi:serine/threonine-protein kinase [Actinomadura gamaensis]|uniref:Serine/threonine-protein kinase n=1 Tax=Actinomadura gamaensis TaxID=1763541 RepID=A0ABV9UA53_9ACTN
MEALRSGDPRRLGGYDVLGRLGAGGQGVVYLGRSGGGRRVAIKLLHPGLTEDPLVRARFVAEAAAAQQVARFCTAEILEVNVAEDQPYVVTEYVEGPSLRRLVAGRGPLAGAELERLAIGMATALAAIHRAGIVHRDFKPANVLIGPDGPRVVDFGLARALDVTATQTGGRPVGTPAYMSPEQLNGDTADLAMDVFAYGATLVYAATGNPPFGTDSIPAVVARILRGHAELGDMRGPLRALAASCLAKDAGSRPTAEQIVLRLLGSAEAAAARRDTLGVLAAGSAAAELHSPGASAKPEAMSGTMSGTSDASGASGEPASSARPEPALPPDVPMAGEATVPPGQKRPYLSGWRRGVLVGGTALVLATLLSAPMMFGHGAAAPRAAGPGLLAPTTSGHPPASGGKGEAGGGGPSDDPSAPPTVFGSSSVAPTTTPATKRTTTARARPSTSAKPPSTTPTRPTTTPPTSPSPQPGILMAERGGVELAPNWGSHSFRIWTETGPVHWTSSYGPYLSAPSSGDLAAGERSEVTVTERPSAPAKGCDQLTLTGELNSRIFTICWD